MQGFASPTWMTYRQTSELNAHVRKGEKGSSVVYANSITRTEEGEQGEESEREIHYPKSYTVFNVEQIEGLPEIYYAKPEVNTTPVGASRRPRSPVRSSRPGKESLQRYLADAVSKCRQKSTRNERILVV